MGPVNIVWVLENISYMKRNFGNICNSLISIFCLSIFLFTVFIFITLFTFVYTQIVCNNLFITLQTMGAPVNRRDILMEHTCTSTSSTSTGEKERRRTDRYIKHIYLVELLTHFWNLDCMPNAITSWHRLRCKWNSDFITRNYIFYVCGLICNWFVMLHDWHWPCSRWLTSFWRVLYL